MKRYRRTFQYKERKMQYFVHQVVQFTVMLFNDCSLLSVLLGDVGLVLTDENESFA